MRIMNPKEIEETRNKIQVSVQPPGQGILSADKWLTLDKELEHRYRSYGKLAKDLVSYGDHAEQVRIVQYNHLWPKSPNFTYANNSMGFRDDHPPLDQVDHCYYGCSMTYGDGVPVESRWTAQLDQQLGTSSNNFGIGGSSVEECMLMFLTTSRLVRMRRAVFFFPDFYRKTVCIYPEGSMRNSRYLGLYFNVNLTDKNEFLPKDCVSKARESYDAQYRLNVLQLMDTFRTHVQTILYVAQLRGIEVVLGTWNDPSAQVLHNMGLQDPTLKIAQWSPMIDEGRDGNHPGIQTHEHWAREFAKII